MQSEPGRVAAERRREFAGIGFDEALLELVRQTACYLPEDVEGALRRAYHEEEPGSSAQQTLGLILQNIEMAKSRAVPLCQDTGAPLFWITLPEGRSLRRLEQSLRQALAEATRRQYLRPNAVDPVSGRNSGDNLGTGVPVVHFEEWDRPEVQVWLILKGGGCENVGAQYSLPDARLGAGRDLEGIRRVILDAVVQAQGKGCPPGVLGVGIGGDRASGYAESKRQLLRPIDDTNPDPRLAELERTVTEQANRLGIGPLGFGGRTTLLATKIGAVHRLPASFFVSISYMCWEYRRRRLIWSPEGGGRASID